LDAADRSLGVALVDMGGGTTDVAVYQNDSIVHSAVLAVGGAHLDQDVAIGLQCSLAAAEQLKIQSGCSSVEQVDGAETISVQRTGASAPSQLPRRLLAEILEPRVSEIFQLVGEAVEQYTPLRSLPAGIVLTGGTSLLPGVCALGEKLLGVPVRPGRVTGVGGLMDSVSAPQHATGVGLALCAWDQRVSDGSVRNAGRLRGPRAWLARVRDVLMGTD
jgi:cell division protein FtsA